MECYYVARNKPIRREITKPQTATCVLSFARVSWTLLWLASTQSTFLKFFRCSRFSEFDSKYLTKPSKWKKFVVYFWLRSHGTGQNFRPVENFVRFGVAFTRNHLAVRKFRSLRHLKFRVNRAKILNRPVWTKGQVRFFFRQLRKIRPVTSERTLIQWSECYAFCDRTSTMT